MSKRVKQVSAVFLALALVFLGSWTVKAETDSNGVSITKTATDAPNGEYTIEFQIPDASLVQRNMKADVVIVIDKSSVNNFSGLQQDASDLVNAMVAKGAADGIDFKVGVIWFNADEHEGTMGLLDISNPANVTTITNAIQAYTGSGTNLYGGVQMAKKWLDADTSTTADNKFIYLASDFAGHLVDDGEEVIVRGGDTGSLGLGRAFRNAAGTSCFGYWTEDFIARYGLGTNAGKSDLTGLTANDINNLVQNKLLFNGSTADDTWLTTVGISCGEIPFDDVWYNGVDPSVIAQLPTQDVYDNDPTIPTSWEKNIYLTGNMLLEMKDAGYKMYASSLPYRSVTDNSVNNIGRVMIAYQEWFGENVGKRYDVSAGSMAEDAFNDMEADIFYLLGKARLTDVINDEFELVPGTEKISLGILNLQKQILVMDPLVMEHLLMGSIHMY